MATKIAQLDISEPWQPFEPGELDSFQALQLLVRFQKKPLGFLTIQYSSGQNPPDQIDIHLETARWFSQPLLKNLLEKSLAVTAPANISQPFLPVVTVAVVSRNRATVLATCLNSLNRLEYPREKLEILVVDNAPEDASTRELVAQFPGFNYVQEIRPGLSWGRNRAIEVARGDIIAFTDDDVEVEPGWLQALVQPFKQENVMTVTGLVMPARRDTEAQDLFEQVASMGKGFERRYYNLRFPGPYSFFPLNIGGVGVGANMAFRKQVLRQLGGFDTALGAGTAVTASEDNDMFYRILRAGYTLVYEPAAILRHYHRSSFAELKRQLRNYDVGNHALLTKTILNDKTMRWQAIAFAFNRLYYKLFYTPARRQGLYRELALAEARGSLWGPIKYFQSLRQQRRVRLLYSEQVENQKHLINE